MSPDTDKPYTVPYTFKRADDVIECSENCLDLFFPDLAPIFAKTSLLDNLCTFDIMHGIKFHWDCISNHLHSLAYCISNIGSMTVKNNSSDDYLLLGCKKVIDILECPDETLTKCDTVAIEFINDAFEMGFKSLMSSSCLHLSIHELDLPVNDFQSSIPDLKATASCLDKMSPPEMVKYTSVCFDQYLRKAARHDLYKCSDVPEECGRPDGVTCLPTHLVNDFYIPILSFGKKCGDIPDKHELQIEDSSETSSTSNDDSGTQVYHADNKDIAYPEDTTYSSPSDKSSLNTISSFENSDSETTTLNSGSFTNDDIIIPVIVTCDTSDSATTSHLSSSALDSDKEMVNDMDYSSTLDYAEKSSATSEIFSFLHLIIVVTGLIF
ncbi:uncharacterized protein TNCT_453261 [Trichonephila clavata]|uniref:Uncharacterized protein n=1 Tax=Trichonephila clavata TaxID=2740835 RepID=A0A8X6G383_TRICU|nr:uncharacterized protein TNCT_453261 [Trichonephila clavata]